MQHACCMHSECQVASGGRRKAQSMSSPMPLVSQPGGGNAADRESIPRLLGAWLGTVPLIWKGQLWCVVQESIAWYIYYIGIYVWQLLLTTASYYALCRRLRKRTPARNSQSWFSTLSSPLTPLTFSPRNSTTSFGFWPTTTGYGLWLWLWMVRL